MGLRTKYAIITFVSVVVCIADVALMSRIHLQGYALRPFVVVAGLCLYVAFGAFISFLAPPKRPVEDTIGDLLSYLLFEGIWRFLK